MTTNPKGHVARVGFSVPNLDGEGETRFEASDAVPVAALTKKQLADFVAQGVIAKHGDNDPPELGWKQGRAIVNGEDVTPEPEPAAAEEATS